MHGYPHRCSTYSERKYNPQFYKDFTSYLTSSGAPPLANGREVPQAPQSIRGHPRAPSNNLRNKTTCNFTRGYATLKTLELGKTLSDNRSRTTSSPWVVKGAPSFTKQFLQDTTQVVLPPGFHPYKKITLQNTTNWLYKIVFTNKKLPRG